MSKMNQFQAAIELARIREHGCLLAKTGRIRLAEPFWQPHLSLEENLTLSIPGLTKFIQDLHGEQLDIWIYTIDDAEYSKDLTILSQTLTRLLCFLSSHDPAQGNSMQQEIESPDWKFSYEGTGFFILVLAPCYPFQHPRSSRSSSLSHFLFQPIESFRKLHNPLGRKERIKARIRKDFVRRGLTLDDDLMNTEFEAYKYIKPLEIGDEPVKWWLSKS